MDEVIEKINPVTPEPYTADGRQTLVELYSRYDELVKRGWQKEIIYIQKRKTPDGVIEFPIFAYLSPKIEEERYLWIMGGVHGEEPAGLNAFAQEIDYIGSLPETSKTPVVFIPILNPDGYDRDWRYATGRRGVKGDLTVVDPDHLLPDIHDQTKPRRPEASSEASREIIDWLIKTSFKNPPVLIMSHHEDEWEPNLSFVDVDYLYSYACGNLNVLPVLSKMIFDCLAENNVVLTRSGKSRFDEEIINGFVFNPNDGSIEQLLTLGTMINNGQRCPIPKAEAAFTIETSISTRNKKIPLADRIEQHKAIIRIYGDLLDRLNRLKSEEVK